MSCSIKKIRQKNIPKENANKSTTPGDQMNLDISSMARASSGGNKHWALMVGKATKYKKSFFLKKKNDQIEVIINWLKELKNKYKIKVQRISMDNAGKTKCWQRAVIKMKWASNLNTQHWNTSTKWSCRKSICDPH